MGAEAAAYEAQRKDFVEGLLGGVCRIRARMYDRMTPAASDARGIREAKAAFCLGKLEQWSRDCVMFVNEAGWAPDPKGEFGSRELPAGLHPARMVPIELYPAQAGLVRELDAMLSCPRIADVNMLKSRQTAATAIVAGWWLLHKWLFHPSFAALLGSFDADVIDPGGKGHREGDSLFARLRGYIDALMWCCPALRFNQHVAWKFRRDAENASWMGDSEDKAFRLVRPRWELFGAERYPEARRNTIKGLLPGDKFGKGDMFTVAFLDEFGEYDRIGAGVDRKARQAVRHSTHHIVTWGTIPEGGGSGSEFKALCDEADSNPTLRNLTMHWTDVLPYMFGAEWRCPSCRSLSGWGLPVLPGPGPSGLARTCGTCGASSSVTRPMVTSPWFRMMCASLRNDPVAIARYLQMDWAGATADRFFWTFEGERVVRARPDSRVRMIDGFDPGFSSANPAALVTVAFDGKGMVPRIVGYWMAKDTFILWWLPFFKRWSPRTMMRQRILRGKYAGDPWPSRFQYPPAALAMMESVSRWPLGARYGDKYGSHRNMADSPYDVLAEMGVDVDWMYEDRSALVRRGREWAARLEIDAEVAHVRPEKGGGGHYPSILDVFRTARPVSGTGQGEVKDDVDKREPAHVSHPADAWFYACRGLPDDVTAAVGADGFWGVEGEREPYSASHGETGGIWV